MMAAYKYVQYDHAFREPHSRRRVSLCVVDVWGIFAKRGECFCAALADISRIGTLHYNIMAVRGAGGDGDSAQSISHATHCAYIIERTRSTHIHIHMH